MTELALLPNRAVLAIGGSDRVAFLNGLVSNDVAGAAPGQAVWAALLSPQGKYLTDFFVLSDGGRLLLDCPEADLEDLSRRLQRYRLRSEVTVEPATLFVHAAWGGPLPEVEGVIAAPDPRLPEAGWRMMSATPLHTTAEAAAWDAHRLGLGLPDSGRDLERDKSILLEAGFDELNGVSWTKGCYMGQELTARTRYRGLIKRRLLPVRGAADLPASGTLVLNQDGREAGILRSVLGRDALALLRLDALHDRLAADGVAIEPRVPAWARLPEPA